jgi:hypothetical protein
MTQLLGNRSDLTHDRLRLRRPRHEAEETRIRSPINDAHAELEREQMKFCTEVHALIKEAIERANQDFAKTSQRYELCEVSGCYTGPLHAGEFACNPIACELRGDGKKLSETLVVELTRDGLIEASLVPHPPVLEIPRTSNDLGWHPVPLPMFGAADASDLVVWYLVAISTRLPIGRKLDHVESGGKAHIPSP